MTSLRDRLSRKRPGALLPGSLILATGLFAGNAFAAAELAVAGLSDPASPSVAVGAATPSAEPGVTFDDAKVQQDPGSNPPLYTVTLTNGHAQRMGPLMAWAKLAATLKADAARHDAVLVVTDTTTSATGGTRVRYDLRECSPYRVAGSSSQGADVQLPLLALSCHGVTGPTPVTP